MYCVCKYSNPVLDWIILSDVGTPNEGIQRWVQGFGRLRYGPVERWWQCSLMSCSHFCSLMSCSHFFSHVCSFFFLSTGNWHYRWSVFRTHTVPVSKAQACPARTNRTLDLGFDLCSESYAFRSPNVHVNLLYHQQKHQSTNFIWQIHTWKNVLNLAWS